MSSIAESDGKVTCMKTFFMWEIHDFSINQTKVGEGLVSPAFYVHKSKFQLEFYPNGAAKKSGRFMSIFLRLMRGRRLVNFELSILDKEQRKHAAFERTELFDFSTAMTWGRLNFIPQSEVTANRSILSPGNTLNIWCEISYGVAVCTMTKPTDECQTRKRPRLEEVEKPESTSSTANVFEKYFDNERLSDVKFVSTDGRHIYAHKIVLENKSDAFASMFSSDFTDKSIDVVNIKNIEHEVLYELFRYIYTGELTDLDKFAGKLLEPAIRFMLGDLKLICEKNLYDNLSVDKAVEMLILAENYNLLYLKEQVKLFIVANIIDFVDLPELKKIMTSRPHLAIELLQCSAQHNNRVQLCSNKTGP